MKVLHVVGARPNFMKAAPVLRAIEELNGCTQVLVHTGQHYDANMSDIFFEQLGMPAPNINLEVGSGTQTSQTAQIMLRFEEVLPREKPDIVLVYGDVNSTMAAALVCAKHHVSIAHVEAGLRSFDRSMPEEVNRLVTDQLANLLFTPSQDGDANLLREGVPLSRIRLVGNVMIDTLIRLLPQAKLPAHLSLRRFALVTLHRPSNVDSVDTLRPIWNTLVELSNDLQIVFPVHPRTRKKILDAGFSVPSRDRILLVEPLGYLEFLALQREATVVITDSGGVQEETTYLGIPCLTLRENTERPVTVDLGTNLLLGRDMCRLKTEVERVLNGNFRKGVVPPLWDGQASHRIARILRSETT